MAFDRTWESIFSSQQWGRYPSEDVVRFISKKFKNVRLRNNVRVLDIGCGGGAHTWFLAREGFEVFGIDGSKSAIEQAQRLLDLDGLNADLKIADFSVLDWPSEYFDVILDSSSIQHNRFESIQSIHEQIFDLLKPGGYFFGILINNKTSGILDAEKLEENTYTNFQFGPIQKNLLVHFFSENEVNDIMATYDEVIIESTLRSVNNRKDTYGHFLVSGRKPL